MKRIVVGLLITIVISVGAGAYYAGRGSSEPQAATTALTRGPISKSVAATGTLQAVTTVSVGSQVSGSVAWLGADFNSVVHKGQVIAKLDPSLLRAELDQTRASLAKTRADVEQASVGLSDAQTKYIRAKELAAKQLIAQSELDAATTAVASAKAQLTSSQAMEVQAKASLSQAQVTLDHTVITAPIDGIVIQRSVDVGQTVAASLSSPTIFVIAADLSKMQVVANIDEADIGQVAPGQPVTFKVDAYPTESFVGTVSQVRLQPTVLSNVVTYSTMIDVPNPQLQLKPGMTANVAIEVASRPDVLRVPNAALRFRPSAELLTTLNGKEAADTARSTGNGRLWTYADGALTPIAVRVGLSDGVNTELVDAPLEAGAQVVTAMTSSASTATARTMTGTARNPLMGGQPAGPRPGR
jgi:HlyD family secretion protein